MSDGAPEFLRDRAAQRAAVEAFVRERPGALLLDAVAPALLDVFSGKSVPLSWDRIEAVARATNRDTGAPYLVLLRDDGRQLVLADVGIAFEPATAAAGPLPGAPALACFRDLAGVAGRLEHLLLHHPDEPVTRDHLDLFRFLLALVDGARAAGFDVSREERRLERILGEIEARRDDAGSPPAGG
ncbi:MAG TPA: hypothetical protein PLL32_09650 [Anaeromyxobacteraceae bacterium]|nr:hypothetical protein [Anaeromyxobacteraceae bacterium]